MHVCMNINSDGELIQGEKLPERAMLLDMLTFTNVAIKDWVTSLYTWS